MRQNEYLWSKWLTLLVSTIYNLDLFRLPKIGPSETKKDFYLIGLIKKAGKINQDLIKHSVQSDLDLCLPQKLQFSPMAPKGLIRLALRLNRRSLSNAGALRLIQTHLYGINVIWRLIQIRLSNYFNEDDRDSRWGFIRLACNSKQKSYKIFF